MGLALWIFVDAIYCGHSPTAALTHSLTQLLHSFAVYENWNDWVGLYAECGGSGSDAHGGGGEARVLPR